MGVAPVLRCFLKPAAPLEPLVQFFKIGATDRNSVFPLDKIAGFKRVYAALGVAPVLRCFLKPAAPGRRSVVVGMNGLVFLAEIGVQGASGILRFDLPNFLFERRIRIRRFRIFYCRYVFHSRRREQPLQAFGSDFRFDFGAEVPMLRFVVQCVQSQNGAQNFGMARVRQFQRLQPDLEFGNDPGMLQANRQNGGFQTLVGIEVATFLHAVSGKRASERLFLRTGARFREGARRRATDPLAAKVPEHAFAQIFAISLEDLAVLDRRGGPFQRGFKCGPLLRRIEGTAANLPPPEKLHHRICGLQEFRESLSAVRPDVVVRIAARRQIAEAQGFSGFKKRQRDIDHAHCSFASRGVAVHRDDGLLGNTPHRFQLLLGHRRSHGRDSRGKPGFEKRDHVHVALGHDHDACFGEGVSG